MPNVVKRSLLEDLERRFGSLRKLPGSQSLFSLNNDAARVYFRYSKLHGRGQAFFGLRDADLRELEGRNAFICFLTDDGSPPLFVPFTDFEEVFRASEPATDGQHKVQLLTGRGTRELFIPKVGRFNMDGYVGLETVAHRLRPIEGRVVPVLSHCQVQTLIAAIGHRKGFDVFVPSSDCGGLDWAMTREFALRDTIPETFSSVESIISEIDVIWMQKGSNSVEGLFEIEHSTPVYSGLLRFNDVLLTDRAVSRFFVVSNDARRDLFVRQVRRPTFRCSGLADLTSFLEYANVYDWHQRLYGEKPDESTII